MRYGDLSKGVEFNKRLDSEFSYSCNACNRCCAGKAIRVGPYEVLRLARHLGLSTTDFIIQNTQSGGTVLRTKDGDCSFLSSRGCTVHSNRPLACRLYPLGMEVSPDGEKLFGILNPHPKTEGIYGTQGSVADYLESQDVGPFFDANDAYEKLYYRMVSVLAKLGTNELSQRPERRAKIDEMDVGTLASAWMDVDGIVGEAGRQAGLSLKELIQMHIGCIEALVDAIELQLGEDSSIQTTPDQL